jgi:hypothetical protein
MKFKIASTILTIFTLIGLGITILTDFESELSLFICIVLYVLIPAYGAYGTFVKSRLAVIISLLFFISQSIRHVSEGSLIPHLAPITISFPLGDFSKGQGYLIDVFAIFMVVLLAWLLKDGMLSHKLMNQEK